MKAWYFSGLDCMLRYGDGRIIKAGETHTVECRPILCEQGLHGSVKPLDAIQYAPGPMVWRVELSGDLDIGDDKIAALERKYLWGYDATHVLRKFARLCALDVIHLWNAPDVVVRYLKTGDESLREAVRATEWEAVRAAVRATEWAARATAREAARAAGEKQNQRLYKMLMKGRAQ